VHDAAGKQVHRSLFADALDIIRPAMKV